MDGALESQCDGLEMERLESAVWVLLCASCGWGHRAPPVQSLHIECSPPMPVVMLPTLHKEKVKFREEGSRLSVCLCRALWPALVLGPHWQCFGS